MCLQVETPLRNQAVKSSQKSTSFMLVFMSRLAAGADIIYNFNTLCLDIYTLCISTHTVSTHYVSIHSVSILYTHCIYRLCICTLCIYTLCIYTLCIYTLSCRIVVSRSHQGDVMKMAEKFKPPGVVTPAGGAGYKVGTLCRYLQELPEWWCVVWSVDSS